MARMDVSFGCLPWAIGNAAMGPGEFMSMGCNHMRSCGRTWSFGNPAMGPCQRMLVGPTDVPKGGRTGALCSAGLGTGAWMSRVILLAWQHSGNKMRLIRIFGRELISLSLSHAERDTTKIEEYGLAKWAENVLNLNTGLNQLVPLNKFSRLDVSFCWPRLGTRIGRDEKRHRRRNNPLSAFA